MNRCRPILQSETVAVALFDHPEGIEHCDPAEEISDEYSINFVEQGGFEIRIGRRRWELGMGNVFLAYPGMEYHCRHADARPRDRCFSVRFTDPEPYPELEAFTRLAQRRVVLSSSNRMGYLLLGMSRAEGPMAVDERAAELLAEVQLRDGTVRPLFQRQQLVWYAERVEAAQEQLRKSYFLNPTLPTLARSVGMSTYHFARVFGELAGLPPHRYLLSIRLREAARHLREGSSVTDACFACGFRNLSHFTRSFQRRYGVAPSRYAN